MAPTPSLNCLLCRIPYQSLHLLNASPFFSENAILFRDFCFFPSLPQSRFLSERPKRVVLIRGLFSKICSFVVSMVLVGSAKYLSVLKRCVPKTLAFAFGLRLRSKTRCFKTRVLGRRLPNGKPQERLRFRGLRSKTLAFKKRVAIAFCDLKTSLGARACV